mmetsp:Transcript_8202/g.25285  ORF Transcript_8202/g.25285 Transcript_8202/m.25285 type:complete len:273 (-) Transcript_8202:1419-2237(-)
MLSSMSDSSKPSFSTCSASDAALSAGSASSSANCVRCAASAPLLTKVAKRSCTSSSSSQLTDTSGTHWCAASRFFRFLKTRSASRERRSATALTSELFFTSRPTSLTTSLARFSLSASAAGQSSSNSALAKVPLPSVSAASTPFRSMPERWSSEIIDSTSRSASLSSLTSEMVSVPRRIASSTPLSIPAEVMPLTTLAEISSDTPSCACSFLRNSVFSAVTRPSASTPLACSRKARSDRLEWIPAISMGLRPRMSPSCCRRRNSLWSRSMVI